MEKCLCCGNEMTRYKFEKYQNMSVEECQKVISEHEESCEWVANFKALIEDMQNVSDQSFIDNYIELQRKVKIIYNILLDNNLTSKENFKNRLIDSTKVALDFEAREKIIKKFEEEYK